MLRKRSQTRAAKGTFHERRSDEETRESARYDYDEVRLCPKGWLYDRPFEGFVLGAIIFLTTSVLIALGRERVIRVLDWFESSLRGKRLPSSPALSRLCTIYNLSIWHLEVEPWIRDVHQLLVAVQAAPDRLKADFGEHALVIAEAMDRSIDSKRLTQRNSTRVTHAVS